VELRKNPLDFLRISAHNVYTSRIIPKILTRRTNHANQQVYHFHNSAAARGSRSCRYSCGCRSTFRNLEDESSQVEIQPGPAPKSSTVKVEADEKGVKIDAEIVNADGSPSHVQYDAKFDGKDYQVTGLPNADTVSVKRIDANTIESTMKKGGQVVMTVTSQVSNYGKTRTSTFKGKDAEGHDVLNVVVSDKQ